MADPGTPRRSISRRLPLTWRILAVNVFVVAMLVGSFGYLEGYRTWLLDERQDRLSHSVRMLDTALGAARDDAAPQIMAQFGSINAARVRRYDADGTLTYDNFAAARPTYVLRDPSEQGINRQLARGLDRFIDWTVRAQAPDDYAEPDIDRLTAWPEAVAARAAPGTPQLRYRFAPDRTPMLSAALSGSEGTLLLMINARDVTRTVRAQRSELGLALALAAIVSILLSLFLARTIVQPLKRLAEAAARLRLGRDRDVDVPRLPEHGDEIGTLARTLSDMTIAMRERIDAGEVFAADVAHELKNPLASLRSALEGLQSVEQPALRAQLLAIAGDDVRRLDRLITDISEASRLDAELSRTRFEQVDVGSLIEPIVSGRQARADAGAPVIAFARPRTGTAVIMGEPARLARVIENLLDNAVSFSPPGGLVRISATAVDGEAIIRVEDEGPGVRADQREQIFNRFHSDRPEGEAFGRHSGLGLAIARTIVIAHDGTITALDRADAASGACFEVRLPLVPA